MPRASIIRIGQHAAGVVASKDDTHLRFYAVQAKFRVLESQSFRSREAAQQAAEFVEISNAKRRGVLALLTRLRRE